ncbi:cytochrome P450 [Xylariaceae sp. FL0255]|nr:cytochrome P450 [Xylariaceae sp. FL0255]
MLLPLAISTVTLLTAYFYTKIRYTRFNQYAHFPQMPTSFALGHLETIDKFLRAAGPKAHPDLAFKGINEALGRPPLMLLDMRPLGPLVVIVRSHEVAEQLSKPNKQYPYSLPKMQNAFQELSHVIGRTSLISSEGEEWKQLRKRFNAGFAPQHLFTLLPHILDKCATFIEHLDRFAETEASFSLMKLASNLTFDIITNVTMDADFNAQKTGQPTEFVKAYHEMIGMFGSEGIILPWYFTPFKEMKRRKLSKRVYDALRPIVRDAYANRKDQSTKSRSILSLSLEQDVEIPSQRMIDEACDQLCTFLFAGHDTTSTLLCWLFYELSRTPHAMKALRKELNDLFGKDPNPAIVRDKLLSSDGQDIVSRMTYTSAVVKEALRLWPPGGTARMTKAGDGLKVQTSMGEFNLDGVNIYPVSIMLHHDPQVYGDTAESFVPERWLQQDESGPDRIPASAWRPFERGPRNCIGQELTNLEARVVVALIARRYDFVKVGLGETRMDDAGKPLMGERGSYSDATSHSEAG